MLNFLFIAATALPLALCLEHFQLQLEPLLSEPFSPEYWFPFQKLDHFNASVAKKWSQRYFMNRNHYKEGGPVFLCVGGEGPALTGKSVYHSVHCNDAVELLPKVQGIMFAVEHRYFGKSSPTDDFSTKNLQWMTSRQALADLDNFAKYANRRYGLGDPNWITFGGSYPGMLSAWARYVYPKTFFASISSSSPIKAKVDFTGYNDVSAESMKAKIVGGSDDCLNTIRAGHNKIVNLLKTTTGKAFLAKEFNICNGAKSFDRLRNIQTFVGGGVVSLPIQGNDPSCQSNGCNIGSICKDFILNEALGDEVARLSALAKLQNGDDCTNIDFYENTIKSALKTDLVGGQERIWLWQTCNEFGFFQTCEENTECPYGQGYYPVDMYYDMCKAGFGVEPDHIKLAVKNTNRYYGGDKPKGTRTMFIQGSVDPWHALGVADVYVMGASHHAWTHPSKESDSEQVKEARQKIWAQVLKWIQM